LVFEYDDNQKEAVIMTERNVEEETKVAEEDLETAEEESSAEVEVPIGEEILEEVQDLKDEVIKDQEDYKSKFFYIAAEMENMKKRFGREKENLVKFGNEKVLKGLIEVVDNFDRTLEAIEKDEEEKVKNIYAGIEMVRKQFLAELKSNGLEVVESLGEIFDPNFHEALAQQPCEGKEDQEIIQVFQQGYKLNGRLLRAAKVVIAKND